MLLSIIYGLYVEGRKCPFNIFDVKLVNPNHFCGGRRSKNNLIIKFVFELFFTDVTCFLFFDGKLKAGKTTFTDLLDASDSFFVVEGLAPLSPH